MNLFYYRYQDDICQKQDSSPIQGENKMNKPVFTNVLHFTNETNEVIKLEPNDFGWLISGNFTNKKVGNPGVKGAYWIKSNIAIAILYFFFIAPPLPTLR